MCSTKIGLRCNEELQQLDSGLVIEREQSSGDKTTSPWFHPNEEKDHFCLIYS